MFPKWPTLKLPLFTTNYYFENVEISPVLEVEPHSIIITCINMMSNTIFFLMLITDSLIERLMVFAISVIFFNNLKAKLYCILFLLMLKIYKQTCASMMSLRFV